MRGRMQPAVRCNTCNQRSPFCISSYTMLCMSCLTRSMQKATCVERHANPAHNALRPACMLVTPPAVQRAQKDTARSGFPNEWSIAAGSSRPCEAASQMAEPLTQPLANGVTQPHTACDVMQPAVQTATSDSGSLGPTGPTAVWITEPLEPESESVDAPDIFSKEFLEDVMTPQRPWLADMVAAASTWRALHSVVVTRVSDPTALTMNDVAVLMQKIAQLAAEVGADEPSREMRLQCRAVVGVAALAALHANAGDEYDGGVSLDAAQVSGMLCALGSLAARRLLERRDMPREVMRLVEFLVRKARRLSAAGQLGPNQLAGVLRAAALLCPPGVVDGSWLKEAELQLLGGPISTDSASTAARAAPSRSPASANGSGMSRLAHDSIAALMTAMTTARASRTARRWRPSAAWLRVFAEQACCSTRLEEMDGHELATVVHGLTELAWPTSSAPYVPTSDELAWLAQQGNNRAWPGSGEGPVMPTSAPLPPMLTRSWLQQVRVREAVLVQNTVGKLACSSSSVARTQWDPAGSTADSEAEPQLYIQPCDLALLLVAYTRLGVDGFYPGRPPGLAPLPLESMFGPEAAAGVGVAKQVVEAADDDDDGV